MAIINNKHYNGADKVSIKKDYADYLMVCNNGFQTNGIQITTEIAALIIQKLSEYLLEKTSVKNTGE